MENETMNVESDFQPRRGRYIMIPYLPEQGTEQHEALINLYFRLQKEELHKVVFHERPDMSLLEFLNFFSGPNTFLQILGITDGDNVVDICGMSWLADVQNCSNGLLTKAVGSFAFFSEYQKPAYTDPLSTIVLDYWFDILRIDILVGLTPASNRAAVLFVKRAGMKEICRIPQYTTYEGEICDGVVTWMSKEEYRSRKGS